MKRKTRNYTKKKEMTPKSKIKDTKNKNKYKKYTQEILHEIKKKKEYKRKPRYNNITKKVEVKNEDRLRCLEATLMKLLNSFLPVYK